MNTGDKAFEQAFEQALADLRAGEEKPIEHYLRLVPEEDRPQLSRMLADVFLARGPGAAMGEPESEAHKRAVAVVEEVLGSRGTSGILPGGLKAMRNARGIEPGAVVAKLAADFEVEGEEGRQALARNYHRLETGSLLGSKLSRRLLKSLAAVFDVDAADVLAAARPAGEGPHLRSVPAMGRSGDPLDAPPSRSAERLPDPEVELVERLFHGGPDA